MKYKLKKTEDEVLEAIKILFLTQEIYVIILNGAVKMEEDQS